MSLTEGAEYMKKQYALSFSTDEIVSGVLKIIEDFYFYEVGLKNNAKEILQFLESNNIKMIIATSSDKTHIKKAFERLGILKYFTDIVTCSQIGKGKTSPDIYLACADKLGTAPSETLVFEDAVFAAETAHKAGFKTVGVYDESSRNDKNRIKAVCDYYADSFENQSISLDFRVCCKSQRYAPLLHLLAVKMHHAHRALADTDGANQNEQNAQPDAFQNHL